MILTPFDSEQRRISTKIAFCSYLAFTIPAIQHLPPTEKQILTRGSVGISINTSKDGSKVYWLN